LAFRSKTTTNPEQRQEATRPTIIRSTTSGHRHRTTGTKARNAALSRKRPEPRPGVLITTIHRRRRCRRRRARTITRDGRPRTLTKTVAVRRIMVDRKRRWTVGRWQPRRRIPMTITTIIIRRRRRNITNCKTSAAITDGK